MIGDMQIHDRDCLRGGRPHVGGCFDPPAEPVSLTDIDRWTRHLWHVSQHDHMVIGLGGRIQDIVHEMREAAGLPEFGWNTSFPDAEFGECTVHVADCRGQDTHEVRVLP